MHIYTNRVCCDRKKRNSFKLRERRFRPNIRKNNFIIRVVRNWNRLLREMMDALSLDAFKCRLDGALSNPM